MLTIRPATEADWPAIWTLFRQAAEAGEPGAASTASRKLW
jgi:hypothetical protein